MLESTLNLMIAIVKHGSRRPEIRSAAFHIFDVMGIQDTHERREQIFAVQKWIQQNIRFIRDPINAEVVSTPERTMQCGYGDCDDHAVLSACLLQSVGILCRFVIMGDSGYEHVLTECNDGFDWIPIETISTEFPAGTLPPAQKYCRIEIEA